MTKKVGYLGPQGTFCEMAVFKNFDEDSCILKAYPSIEAVFSSVCSEEVDVGVVPIENSCEGIVSQTLDLLAYKYDLKITGEIIMPVQQNLLASPGVKLEDITHIVSHPQALGQCREYIEENFPKAKLVNINSTAEAAKELVDTNKPWAAIGTINAAKTYDLSILASNISHQANNETRFVILSKNECYCTTDCKTSLLINALNKPGELFNILKEFSLRGINMTKIESRPARSKNGEYLFFIDLDGHHLEPKFVDSIENIREVAQSVKILGSYPSATNKTGRKTMLSPSLDYLRQEVNIIDEQIIEMLGRRTQLVEKIGTFKRSAHTVHDPKREQWILEKLSSLAEQKGFSPSVTVKIYKILFKHFISLQQKKK